MGEIGGEAGDGARMGECVGVWRVHSWRCGVGWLLVYGYG
jgi:hypothetical protein